MWQRRWIGLAAAWIVGIAGVVVVMRIARRVRGLGAHLRRHAVGAEAVDAGARGAAQRRSAGHDPEPHADQPAERRKADPHGRSRPEREVQGRPGCDGRRPDEGAEDREHSDATTCTRCPIATRSPTRPSAWCSRWRRSSSNRTSAKSARIPIPPRNSSTSRSRSTRRSSRKPRIAQGIQDQAPVVERMVGKDYFTRLTEMTALLNQARASSCAKPSNRATRSSASLPARSRSCCRTTRPASGLECVGAGDRWPDRGAEAQARRVVAAVHRPAPGRHRHQAARSRSSKSRRYRCSRRAGRRQLAGPKAVQCTAIRCTSS